MIPNGWMTYIGVAIKVLSALAALLAAYQNGGDPQALTKSFLETVAPLFVIGSSVSSAGLRRAISNIPPAK